MSTRWLLILSLITAFVILIAFGVWLAMALF